MSGLTWQWLTGLPRGGVGLAVEFIECLSQLLTSRKFFRRERRRRAAVLRRSSQAGSRW